MKTLKKKLSLAITHPAIAKQWHPTKNEGLSPPDVTYGSGKRVWWLCDEGHEWRTIVKSRAGLGSGCPECYESVRGQKRIKAIIKKKGSLADIHPDIAEQWHSDKNRELKPNQVTRGSNLIVWWLCDSRHEWKAKINHRTYMRSGCPECSKENRIKALIRKKGNLADTHPAIAKQWHPTKNGDLTADDLTSGSNKKVWWLCDNGHKYEAGVRYRTLGGGCRKCYDDKRKRTTG